jgi:anaphase-promoting complex subunit 1
MLSVEESIQLDFEKEKTTSNRRVSSLVARADLSGSLDRMAFNDIATANPSFHQPPVDDLLNELNNGLGFGNIGLYDGEGLRNEILMTKIESFPSKMQEGRLAPDYIPRVFTMMTPMSSTMSASEGRRVVLVIVNRADSSVLQLTLLLPNPTSAVTTSFL